MNKALGIIETIGLTSAITALDAASKAANVELIGTDKVIGTDKAVSIVIYMVGSVSDVKAAVEAGKVAAMRVGKISSASVIARPHEELDKIIQTIKSREKNKNIKTENKI